MATGRRATRRGQVRGKVRLRLWFDLLLRGLVRFELEIAALDEAGDVVIAGVEVVFAQSGEPERLLAELCGLVFPFGIDDPLHVRDGGIGLSRVADDADRIADGEAVVGNEVVVVGEEVSDVFGLRIPCDGVANVVDVDFGAGVVAGLTGVAPLLVFVSGSEVRRDGSAELWKARELRVSRRGDDGDGFDNQDRENGQSGCFQGGAASFHNC